MAQKLSNMQQRILSSITKYTENNDGRPPTYREIGQAVRVTSLGQIAYHLKALEEKGYIQRVRNISRSITVVKDGQGSSLSGSTAIAAGPPRTIMSAIEEEEHLFPKNAFVLPIEGNSMIEDAIFDGDYIIVDPRQPIANGDIVVATHLTAVGSELGAATVKRFYQEGERIRLQPANPEMAPLYVDAQEWDNEWWVQGQVKAVVHLLKSKQ
jgi:repressor LexA